MIKTISSPRGLRIERELSDRTKNNTKALALSKLTSYERKLLGLE